MLPENALQPAPAPLEKAAAWPAYGSPLPRGVEPVAAAVTPVAHYLWMVRRHRWKLLSFIALAVGVTIIVSSRLMPMYESTVTIDIDRDVPTGIVGADERRGAPNDADQYLATQIDLIQSDSVLRPVADQYHLREVERDSSDPVVQDAIREHDAPIVLKRLRVVRPPNTYLLRVSYRSSDPQLAANVANGVAKSYLEQTHTIRFRSSASLSTFMEKQQEELKATMERSSAALTSFERDLNVISPEEKTSIVSARLTQLNAEYTTAQADRARKEAIYNIANSGSPNALQISTQGEPLVKLQERMNQAEERFAEIKSHFGVNHPEYQRAAEQVAVLQRQIQQTRQDITQRLSMDFQSAVNREAILQKEIGELKKEFDRLNARSFEYQALKRESEADKNLYAELIRKIREGAINAGFKSNSIRIADAARPALRPVFPRTGLNALLAFLFSSLLGLVVIITTDVVNVTVRDPEDIAKLLRIEVVGTLPPVRSLRNANATAASGNRAAQFGQLVRARASVRRNLQQYEQAIQTLRNSIMLADFEGRLRSVMITSACPFEGKSTIASHFAVANAKSGHRTLLIDGDLRRPSVQKVLNLEGEKGLADVLAEGVSWRNLLVQPETVENLDVLLAGSGSLRSPDLITLRLQALIEEASKTYDLVVLDSPPVQGFPEPLRMATTVDGVLVVALAGSTSRKALSGTVAALTRLRARVLGLVLNQVANDAGESGYYAYYNDKR